MKCSLDDSESCDGIGSCGNVWLISGRARENVGRASSSSTSIDGGKSCFGVSQCTSVNVPIVAPFGRGCADKYSRRYTRGMSSFGEWPPEGGG